VKFTNDAKSTIETFAKHTVSGFRAFGNPESVDVERFPTRVRGRFPSLDGLRAVAILLVIQSHLAGGRYILPGWGTGHFPLRFAYGHLGVRIFFVISGFLITTLLLQEHDKQGRISLKQFYIRRALRILPASYVFMLVLIILAGMGVLSIPLNSFLASFLYVRNYFGGGDWYTGHLWSLSVEEQFYLIWPAAMVSLGRRRAVVVAFCTLPAACLLRFTRPYFGFETNMDGLACGCILACLWGWLGRNEGYQRFLRSRLFWVLPSAILASVALVRYEGTFIAITGITLTNILIAASLERFVRYHRLSAANLLNSRLAVYLGTLSYSLYLWQQLWIVRKRTPFPFWPWRASSVKIGSWRMS
jgi:peptidoglycan/LPS O-acetylase OafA/YrhL